MHVLDLGRRIELPLVDQLLDAAGEDHGLARLLAFLGAPLLDVDLYDLALLDLAGFEAVPTSPQAREGMAMLAALYALAPVVLKLAAIGIMRGYRLEAGSLSLMRSRAAPT